MKKQDIFIEFTTTNRCNCSCKYCFEHNSCTEYTLSLDEELRLLNLLLDVCTKFDYDKFNYLTVSIWGGEPFLNVNFIKKLIENTYTYEFVRYHIYTNATLVNEILEFLELPYISNIRSRLHFQLSYDGEPAHSLMRADNSHLIFNVADALIDKLIMFNFKATLSFEMIKYLEDIWDSYKHLHDKYGKIVRYFPTLDTTCSNIEFIPEWKALLKKIVFKELKFLCNNGYPLWGWFNEHVKHNCMLGNSIHINTDGNIYVCHGAPYLKHKDNLILGNTSNIDSLYSVISTKYQYDDIPIDCKTCTATYCSVCHVVQLDKNDDPCKEWINCRTKNINRCKYFKIFGAVSKYLRYLYIKEFGETNGLMV